VRAGPLDLAGQLRHGHDIPATGPIGDFAEFDLGTVTITDNMFSLYTDHADVITDRGAFPYYGWAWIRLVPAQTEYQINCWDDDHQDPVLATSTNVGDLIATDGVWTEFLYTPSRPYPSILAGADEENYGLPVMRFFANGISNGEYEVIANLYTNTAGRDMRYYYGYTPGDPNNPKLRVGSWTTANLSGYWSNEALRVQVGVNNLTNEGPKADETDSWPFYPQEYHNGVGRQYYLRVSYSMGG